MPTRAVKIKANGIPFRLATASQCRYVLFRLPTHVPEGSMRAEIDPAGKPWIVKRSTFRDRLETLARGAFGSVVMDMVDGRVAYVNGRGLEVEAA